jgi:hypothetical protein
VVRSILVLQLNQAHPSFATRPTLYKAGGHTAVRPNGVFVKPQRLSCCGFVPEGAGWQFLFLKLKQNLWRFAPCVDLHNLFLLEKVYS